MTFLITLLMNAAANNNNKPDLNRGKKKGKMTIVV